MFVIVSYDIEDDKTRTRLAKKLLDFGPRVQFSVFEADITKKELEKLKTMLKAVQLKEKDSIRLYRLCEMCTTAVEIWGKGEVTKDKDFYLAWKKQSYSNLYTEIKMTKFEAGCKMLANLKKMSQIKLLKKGKSLAFAAEKNLFLTGCKKKPVNSVPGAEFER